MKLKVRTSLFWCLIILIHNLFFIPKQNVTSSSFKLLNLVFSLQALLKSHFLSFPAALLLVLEGCTRSLLFSRMNNHNSLRLSSEERCSRLLINFVALLWTHSNRSKIWHPRLQKKLGYLAKDCLHTIWQGFMLEPLFWLLKVLQRWLLNLFS